MRASAEKPGAETAEDALVDSARADPAAFAPLYERYLPRVYAYLRARAESEPEAEDLTQQVFLRALAALPDYRARGLPFAAWLFRIAHNALADARRRRHRTVLPWDGLPAWARQPETSEPEPAALRRERLHRRAALLRELDPAKRELLALRFAAGLTAREIARVVGKSEAAVQRQLARTLQQLKEADHGDG